MLKLSTVRYALTQLFNAGASTEGDHRLGDTAAAAMMSANAFYQMR